MSHNYPMTDYKALEATLTQYFAEVLNLAIDEEIFRGGIPSGVEHGVGVIFKGEVRDGTLNPRVTVQVLGKFDTRDEALEVLTKLSDCAPRYGVDNDGYSYGLSAILPTSGVGSPYLASDRGKVKHFISCNYLVLYKEK